MNIETLLTHQHDFIDYTSSLQEAIEVMTHYEMHYIIIVQESRAVGILTETDIVRLYHEGVDFGERAYHYAAKMLISVNIKRPINFILTLMSDNTIKRIVITNDEGEYCGTVSLEDIIYLFEAEVHQQRTLINQLCHEGNAASIIAHNASLEYALDTMCQKSIESIVVGDKDCKPIGIITQSDIVKLAKSAINLHQEVNLFMHTPILTIDTNLHINDAIEKMRKHRIRHLMTRDNDGEYYIIGLKEILNNLRGNYSTFLENKLKDTRHTFDAMQELVIEVLDFGAQQIISWMNKEAKNRLNLAIDAPIAKLFDTQRWQEIYAKLQECGHYSQKIHLGDAIFGATFSHNDILGTKIIKVLLNDITQIETLNTQLLHNIEQNYQMTLQSLVELVESRDTYTGGHSLRVATYSKAIAAQMKLSQKECELVYQAGILHDIGKIVTPDTVLLNPGKLSPLDYKLIQEHVQVGYSILSKIPMYHDIANIIRYHHERYDGKGYPYGIQGEEIPLLASILAIADSFDAMTTNRIYKARKSKEEAIEDICNNKSKQFHLEIVKKAKIAFEQVEIDATASQLPTNPIEQERFAYFYRDRLSNAYNEEYLNHILSTNRFECHYRYVHLVSLHNFNNFNQRESWQMGNRLLAIIADYFIKSYPLALVVRIHGDDFAMLSKELLEIDIEAFTHQAFFAQSQLEASLMTIDLERRGVESLDELESLIRSIGKSDAK